MNIIVLQCMVDGNVNIGTAQCTNQMQTLLLMTTPGNHNLYAGWLSAGRQNIRQVVTPQ